MLFCIMLSFHDNRQKVKTVRLVTMGGHNTEGGAQIASSAGSSLRYHVPLSRPMNSLSRKRYPWLRGLQVPMGTAALKPKLASPSIRHGHRAGKQVCIALNTLWKGTDKGLWPYLCLCPDLWVNLLPKIFQSFYQSEISSSFIFNVFGTIK